MWCMYLTAWCESILLYAAKCKLLTDRTELNAISFRQQNVQ